MDTKTESDWIVSETFRDDDFKTVWRYEQTNARIILVREIETEEMPKENAFRVILSSNSFKQSLADTKEDGMEIVENYKQLIENGEISYSITAESQSNSAKAT